MFYSCVNDKKETGNNFAIKKIICLFVGVCVLYTLLVVASISTYTCVWSSHT